MIKITTRVTIDSTRRTMSIAHTLELIAIESIETEGHSLPPPPAASPRPRPLCLVRAA